VIHRRHIDADATLVENAEPKELVGFPFPPLFVWHAVRISRKVALGTGHWMPYREPDVPMALHVQQQVTHLPSLDREGDLAVWGGGAHRADQIEHRLCIIYNHGSIVAFLADFIELLKTPAVSAIIAAVTAIVSAARTQRAPWTSARIACPLSAHEKRILPPLLRVKLRCLRLLSRVFSDPNSLQKVERL
jgi:hypothetical protein